ncbi:MAG: methyltransferase domain-containing protein [Polyangiaceae bacterium]|nr:methyltransferase domain-containing protein [Polyangiaceae bacterium]
MAEAAHLAATIRAAHPEARSLLDVACGTAEHARLLVEMHGFEADALDLHPAFVDIARKKLPLGAVYEADMATFALEARYDVILCLFSSIGYLRSLENVRSALGRFRAHLKPNGVVLVEPWFPPGVLVEGRVSTRTVKTPELSICRMSFPQIACRLSHLHFHYLIGRAGLVEHTHEVHTLGLFTTDEMLQCFQDAGLKAEYDPVGPYGRGLFVARAT